MVKKTAGQLFENPICNFMNLAREWQGAPRKTEASDF